jgi:hypothetical protein
MVKHLQVFNSSIAFFTSNNMAHNFFLFCRAQVIAFEYESFRFRERQAIFNFTLMHRSRTRDLSETIVLSEFIFCHYIHAIPFFLGKL